jgi:SM-20-related protein
VALLYGMQQNMQALRQDAAAANLTDLSTFESTPLVREPFEYLVVPNFVRPDALARIIADFPNVPHAGLTPLSEVTPSGAFAALIDELRGSELEDAFSAKFGIDLSHLPLMVTLRSRCQQKDGRIHTDTETKIVTALLYLNEPWQGSGGRLRFLRGPDDIEDAIAEVPPEGGVLAAFRRCDRSFHGHKPFVGVRRYIMLNWMTSETAMRRELARHRLSARVKRLWGAR